MTRGAHVAAGSAVCRVAIRLHTFIAALQKAWVARPCAGTALADKAIATHVAAGSAVLGVTRRVHAQAIASGAGCAPHIAIPASAAVPSATGSDRTFDDRALARERIAKLGSRAARSRNGRQEKQAAA